MLSLIIQSFYNTIDERTINNEYIQVNFSRQSFTKT